MVPLSPMMVASSLMPWSDRQPSPQTLGAGDSLGRDTRLLLSLHLRMVSHAFPLPPNAQASLSKANENTHRVNTSSGSMGLSSANSLLSLPGRQHPYRMEAGRLGAGPGKPPESPGQPFLQPFQGSTQVVPAVQEGPSGLTHMLRL